MFPPLSLCTYVPVKEFIDKLADLMNTYPPLWMIYGFVLVLPFVLMACCFIKPKSKVRTRVCVSVCTRSAAGVRVYRQARA